MNIPLEKHWYAVYTAPRAEKKVGERFIEAGVEYYLPLKTVKRQWSDRIKDVVIPVITGYIFVNLYPTQFLEILKVHGAISFVREFGRPVVIPEQQMKMLRFMCDCTECDVELSTEDFKPGEAVTVVRGPLKGLMGELVKVNGKHRVVIRIENLGCASTTIPLSFLKKG